MAQKHLNPIQNREQVIAAAEANFTELYGMGGGTVVYVNGVAVASLSFSSDPQTQLNGKLDTTGDGSNVTVTIGTETKVDVNTDFATGSRLSTLWGKAKAWFASLGSLAFKSTVTSTDVDGTIAKTSDLSGYVTLATAQTISGEKTFSANKTYTKRLEITDTSDIAGTSDTTAVAPLLIGAKAGVHLEFDQNEIMAKNSANSVGELFLNSEGGNASIGNGLSWYNLETKRSNLTVKGNIIDYGAWCGRGVDAATDYDGYFKLAEASFSAWYRGAKAVIRVQDKDNKSWGLLAVTCYVGNNGTIAGTGVELYESTSLSDYRGKFFLVVQQNKSTNGSKKVASLWYKPSGTYQRIDAQFLYEIQDSRLADSVTSRWLKWTRASATEQTYVSTGTVDLTNGFVPTASWGTSVFTTADYPDVDIVQEISQMQFEGGYNAIRNNENIYSDTPATATSRYLQYTDKSNNEIAGIYTTIGSSWNALNLRLRSKGNVQRVLEFVHYPGSSLWNFDCTTDGEVNLGTTTRRWRNLFLSGNISIDGTYNYHLPPVALTQALTTGYLPVCKGVRLWQGNITAGGTASIGGNLAFYSVFRITVGTSSDTWNTEVLATRRGGEHATVGQANTIRGVGGYRASVNGNLQLIDCTFTISSNTLTLVTCQNSDFTNTGYSTYTTVGCKTTALYVKTIYGVC